MIVSWNSRSNTRYGPNAHGEREQPPRAPTRTHLPRTRPRRAPARPPQRPDAPRADEGGTRTPGAQQPQRRCRRQHGDAAQVFGALIEERAPVGRRPARDDDERDGPGEAAEARAGRAPRRCRERVLPSAAAARRRAPAAAASARPPGSGCRRQTPASARRDDQRRGRAPDRQRAAPGSPSDGREAGHVAQRPRGGQPVERTGERRAGPPAR